MATRSASVAVVRSDFHGAIIHPYGHPSFISFDYDNNQDLRTLLAGQAKNPDSPFEIADWSVKEAFAESELGGQGPLADQAGRSGRVGGRCVLTFEKVEQ